MKKTLFAFMALAAAFVATSCQNDEEFAQQPTNKPMVINAVAEGIGTGTRATMAYKYDILWSENDEIYVKSSEENATFTLTTGQGTTNGTFECTESPFSSGDAVEAFYPATLIDNGNLVWPAEQTSTTVVPMYSKNTISGTSTENFSFASLGAMLQIVFNTKQENVTLKSITIKDDTNPLSGTFTVNGDGKAVMAANTDAPGITYDLGETGKALGDGANYFNIAVPAGEYSSLTITFTATDESTCTLKGGVTIKHNTVGKLTLTGTEFKAAAPDVPEGFVDLGVVVNSKPLFWAKCNLGASKPEEYGTYFSWGETGDGRSATTSGSGAFSTKFNWDNDAFGQNFEKVAMATACPDGVLALAYDAAYQKDNSWRMPTKEDFMELFKQCFAEWTADYDGTKVQGLIVWKAKGEDAGWFKPSTAGKGRQIKTDGTYNTAEDHTFSNVYAIASDAHIFFPAAGFGDGDTFCTGSYPFTGGYYWSTTLRTGGTNANILNFNSNNVINPTANYSRYCGYSVRPVTTEAAAPTPPLPAGALAGEFSVSATKKVHFSKGNLQATYNSSASAYTWGFAANQYDRIGNAAGNTTIGSQTNGAVVDLFGWVGAGSTKFNSSPEIYGVSTSNTISDYGDVGGEALKADWGTAIDDKGTWSTLSIAEWQYLFAYTTSGTNKDTGSPRYNLFKAPVTVCGKTNCVVIAPDDWDLTAHPLQSSYGTESSKDSPMTWEQAEAAGLVCLPAAGCRVGSNVSNVDFEGVYWSSSAVVNDYYKSVYSAYISSGVGSDVEIKRYVGCSVRLVTVSN
ncbi:MAG: hypothetical protein Q4A08_08680 [Bacteroidales bacterium]|nr:hypothetical protein [Bacteroidales bacterium]